LIYFREISEQSIVIAAFPAYNGAVGGGRGMDTLHIADTIARLRKEKKMTQEELADFIGVTKASVSKWENGQSLPDILLLPQLAAFFGISLDNLFGYEPQLSREQIQRLYFGFASAFAKRPFADVFAEVRAAARQYYACYPLLLQLCVLYLNHYFMAKDPQEAQTLLKEARALCAHILEGCKSPALCGDAASLLAMINLQLGDAEAVIEALEPMLDPARLSKQDDVTLIHAYRLAGKAEQAADQAQISMYLNLLAFVSSSVLYLSVSGGDREACKETIRRIDTVAAAYHLSQLHPNVTAQFEYQAALTFTAFGEHEQALKRLDEYAKAVRGLLAEGHFALHGDGYFTRLGSLFEKLALGATPPRDQALVRQSALLSLQNPAFQPLQAMDAFQSIQKTLEKE
jgi:transcriptional regulator with XRE-family HTH domain